ncbi:MAG: nucleotidyltransferase domain-containing protein [bacterium]
MKQLKHLKLNEKKALEELVKVLKEKYRDKIKEIRLFGSKVRDKVNHESDLDIFILFAEDADWKFKDNVARVIYDLILTYDSLFDLTIFSENELKDKRIKSLPFYKNILKEGVLI